MHGISSKLLDDVDVAGFFFRVDEAQTISKGTGVGFDGSCELSRTFRIFWFHKIKVIIIINSYRCRIAFQSVPQIIIYPIPIFIS